MNVPRSILLSRPDNLGDAVMTLPMAGWIKHHAPSTRILVLARAYARPAWARCAHADEIITLEELESSRDPVDALRRLNVDAVVHAFPHRRVANLASRAGIRRRIGTSHRWWHWFTCNERVAFSRKRSDLHEAQLNIKLLEPFSIPPAERAGDLVPHIGFRVPAPSPAVRSLLRPDRRSVILHPLTKGSAVEWGLQNFAALIGLLDPARYQVLITGTADDAARYRPSLPINAPHVTDTGGTLSLDQLMELIGASSALVAASTGPLHIAAASGIRAIGLFSMRRPVFPARWAPIGKDAHALVDDPNCKRCARGQRCDCVTRIEPARVVRLLEDEKTRRREDGELAR